MVREGLYLICVDREAKPGFGHIHQVSLAFRLVFGLYQVLCCVCSAFCPVQPARRIVTPLITPRARKRFLTLGFSAKYVIYWWAHKDSNLGPAD